MTTLSPHPLETIIACTNRLIEQGVLTTGQVVAATV